MGLNSEKSMSNHWLENGIASKDKQTAEWRLTGSIGQWRDIKSIDFNRQLASLEAKYSTIDMILHSGGGSITEGLQMYNRLLKSRAKTEINTDIEGMAASMASVIAMAGKHRRMAKYGRMMLHQGRNSVSGSGNHLIEKGRELLQYNQQLAEIYAEAIKWKHPDRDAQWVLDNWLVEGKDKWFTASEALEAGLIHEVYDSGLKGAPASASYEDMVAFYDNSLAELELPEQKEPTKEPVAQKPKTSNQEKHTMKKEQLILAFAKLGITFDDTVTAEEGNDEAFVAAISAQVKQLQERANQADKLQASLAEQNQKSFEDELQAAQKDGRIATKQVPHYEKLAEKFGSGEAIAALKEIDTPSADIELKKKAKKPVDATLSKEREQWNYQAWEENDQKGLMALADEDPEKYQAILADYDPQEESNAKKD